MFRYSKGGRWLYNSKSVCTIPPCATLFNNDYLINIIISILLTINGMIKMTSFFHVHFNKGYDTFKDYICEDTCFRALTSKIVPC